MFVVDTNVMSASDPLKQGLSAQQRDRLSRMDIFLPTPVIAEVKIGLLRLQRLGASAKVRLLTVWWANVETVYADRILDFDLAAANEAAAIADRAAASGQDPGWVDIQIAAIAASRNFTVLTRNARHFKPLGVPHLDPFSAELPA